MSSKTWGIDDGYFTAIGQINVAFQYLEGHLGYLVYELLGVDRRVAQCVTVEMGFDKLVNLINSLFRLRLEQYGERKPEFAGLLKATLAKANRAKDERNRIIHSIWGFDKNFQLVIEKLDAKSKHGLRAMRREQDLVEDLLKIVEEIVDADNSVLDFCRRFAGAYHDLRRSNCGHLADTSPEAGGE